MRQKELSSLQPQTELATQGLLHPHLRLLEHWEWRLTGLLNLQSHNNNRGNSCQCLKKWKRGNVSDELKSQREYVKDL